MAPFLTIPGGPAQGSATDHALPCNLAPQLVARTEYLGPPTHELRAALDQLCTLGKNRPGTRAA